MNKGSNAIFKYELDVRWCKQNLLTQITMGSYIIVWAFGEIDLAAKSLI